MPEDTGDKPLAGTEKLLKTYLNVSSPNAVKGFNGAPGELSTEQLSRELQTIRRIKSGVERREKLIAELLQIRLKAENVDWITSINAALEKGEMPADEVCQKSISLPGTNGNLVFVGQRRLDTEKVEAEMGSLWVESHKKVIGMFQIKFSKGEAA